VITTKSFRTPAWAAGLAFVVAPLVIAGCARNSSNVYNGYVEGEYVYLATSQPGQLTRLSVARGDTVAADALVFELESANESHAVSEARRQLQAAQAQVSDMLVGKRRPELAVIQAQLEQARADATRAQIQLQRDEKQYTDGGIAKSQLDDSRSTAASTAARVRELESQLQVARLPGRNDQIRAQTETAEAAQAALAQAEWKLDQKRVRAPQSGLVFDTLYRLGEWVPAGSPVVRMLPPANVKVRFYVPETAVGSLTPGRSVRVRCDGCAADVAASIRFVSDQAEYTPPVIYSNETRAKLVFLVEARPAPADALKLHPGQPVEVILP
jgi:HlyD family secretion protein